MVSENTHSETTSATNAISEYDEELLQGVFNRIWKYLKENGDRSTQLSHSLSTEELRDKIDLTISNNGANVETLLEDIDSYLNYSVRTSHPHFMNPFWGGTSVPSLVGEFITTLTNTSMYTFEIAPVATLIEKEMIKKMTSVVGYKEGGGTFTSGGSNGNLMGMLCARDYKFPTAKRDGLIGKKLVAFVSNESHYSVKIAANILGIGMDNLIGIESDTEGRMNTTALKERISLEKKAGNIPFCVIATSGTTVKGAFDPLSELADICESEDIWLHVDAAWGGAALLSPKTRILLDGIERANSLCWDPHKMMGMPISCSVFLVRNSEALKTACSHNDSAHYLLHKEATELDLGRLSLQCGRRVDALKLWLSWRATGDDGWATMVEKYVNLAKYLTNLVSETSQLDLVCKPGFTNVCIRYARTDTSEETEDAITNTIRDELIQSGKFMITKAMIDGRPILRPVIANRAVDEKSLKDLIIQIQTIGDRLASNHL